MKCWSSDRLEEALVNGTMDDLERHMKDCPCCSERVERQKRDQEVWNNTLFSDRLPDSFTRDVVDAIEDMEIEVVCDNYVYPENRKYKRYRGGRYVAAAVILLLVFGLLLYAQPTIAQLVRSLFAVEANTDIGLLEARELGIVQNPHVKVTDRGYTVEINEVVADATRIVMAIKTTNSKGNQVKRPDSGAFDWTQLSIMNSKGERTAELKGLGGAIDFDKLTFILTKPLPDNTLIVEGNIDRLIQDLETKLPGHWAFRFELDMTHANELSFIESLGERYTTPEGLHIEMDRLVRTPSGVRLELNTSWKKDPTKRATQEMQDHMELMFHFEDEHGQDIFSARDSLSEKSSEMDADGRTHWTYNFIYLPYNRQKIRFVFDGYDMPVYGGAEFKFQPSTLTTKPVTVKDQGDTLRLLDMTVGDDPNRSDGVKAALLTVEGQFHNPFRWDEWVVIDSEGRSYSMSFRGGVEMGEVKVINGDPGFIIDDLKEIPEELTLKRVVVDTLFTDVDWSFDLPRGQSYEGIDESALMKLWE